MKMSKANIDPKVKDITDINQMGDFTVQTDDATVDDLLNTITIITRRNAKLNERIQILEIELESFKKRH